MELFFTNFLGGLGVVAAVICGLVFLGLFAVLLWALSAGPMQLFNARDRLIHTAGSMETRIAEQKILRKTHMCVNWNPLHFYSRCKWVPMSPTTRLLRPLNVVIHNWFIPTVVFVIFWVAWLIVRGGY